MSLENVLSNWSKYRRGAEEGGHHEYEHKWAMMINLDLCIGCNACSTACYAENNLAVVGKDRFSKGQAMHWMRIERYWDQADKEFPEQGASFLPMMCQQCNSATCEPVCPVAATYHTPDGLNAQVYNRCIGSRYCSNNCPFRVRYFNFYSYYESSWPEPLNMQLNPDLSVRDKGVMEKCTFCVQRIRVAKDKAKMENRKVGDDDFKPACVQGCPTSAMMFGDYLDEDSQVRKTWDQYQVKMGPYKQDKQEPELRGYRVFEGLNVDPSVLYLERVREEV
ncbi:MAG: 4Fe-4S dicluster domain-containing protein [Gammaproteobacteria bacterium]|jgi:molybdopterin-containing oxidoreductase family iron-sulfur binding subunit|nr:4Fe-4S dicluster domain-containing protein [Gammaproteobacteria bacterium]